MLRKWFRAALRHYDNLVARWLRRLGVESIETHNVYVPPLGPDSIVVDAGANRGRFSHQLIARFGCRCLALEPVAELAGAIQRAPRLTVLSEALSARTGPLDIHISSNPEANSIDVAIAGSEQPRTLPARALQDLAAYLGGSRIDLLKLDIEGSELEVLENLPPAMLEEIGQMTVEFHDFVPGHNSRRRILAIRRRLRAAGFLELITTLPWGHHGDSLFLNSGRLRLTVWFHLQHYFLTRVALPFRSLRLLLVRESP